MNPLVVVIPNIMVDLFDQKHKISKLCCITKLFFEFTHAGKGLQRLGGIYGIRYQFSEKYFMLSSRIL